MNTSRNRMLELTAAVALVIAFSSGIYAGPGPQFWQRNTSGRAENAAQKTVAAPAQPAAAASAMACSSCKTKVYEETGMPNLADKTRPRAVKVGVSHYCDGCTGTITRISGAVTDAMKRNHAACVTKSCCTVS